jgi:hypothetical protein
LREPKPFGGSAPSLVACVRSHVNDHVSPPS